MLEFREKTGEAAPGAINAGAYVLERSLLELIPPGEQVSIEREVFPRLIGEGLYALLLDGYWMDFGTPERYLQATWDILEGRVRRWCSRPGPACSSTPTPRSPPAPSRAAGRDRRRLPGRARGGGARLGPARRLLGRRGRPRDGSILAAGVALEAGAELDGAVVGRDERVPPA